MNIIDRINFTTEGMRAEGMEIRAIYLPPDAMKELVAAVGHVKSVQFLNGHPVREAVPKTKPRIYSTRGIERRIPSAKRIAKLSA